MTDTVDSQTQQQQLRWTPTKPSFHGPRMSGRAFNSPNWRVKEDDDPNSPSSEPHTQQTNPLRSTFGRHALQVPRAIAEGRRLYVGNMPYMAKKEDVYDLFAREEYQIERVDISIDPFTGRNPSYCFVELETRKQADQAMKELDGRDLLGRPVKIRPGVAKSPVDRTHPKQEGPPRNSEKLFAFDRWQRNDAFAHFKGYSEQGRRLYVGGLPKLSNQAIIDSEIQKFFAGYNIEAISKLISPHPSKRVEPGDHYYLFVDFPSPEEAQMAMNALDGRNGPWGGRLRVSKARGDSSKPDERQRWAAARGKELPTAPETAAAA